MKTCCFIGHRKVKKTPELIEKLEKTVINLIKTQNVGTFLFGSKSNFDELCLKKVSELKNVYPEIKLIYVRSHFPYISKDYTNYLLKTYDDTFIPNGVENSGKASYVKRNRAMIDLSDFCVFYYDLNYNPPMKSRLNGKLPDYQPKSGTHIAYEYANKRKKEIINLYK